jgi:4-azaleucine resistance transporter AzlC
MAPILLGIVPFGLIAGISAVSVGLTPVHGVGMSLMVFAGASQLAALQLVGKDAPFLVIAATALIINARFVMYSASLAPYLQEVSSRYKVLASYLLTDQAYAFSINRFVDREEPKRVRLSFYLGSAVILWVTWQAATAVGAFVGTSLPASWSLDFAIPLVFIALLVPAIRDRSDGVAAGVAAVLAVLLVGLPYNLGLPLAATTGIGAGVLAERRSGRS